MAFEAIPLRSLGGYPPIPIIIFAGLGGFCEVFVKQSEAFFVWNPYVAIVICYGVLLLCFILVCCKRFQLLCFAILLDNCVLHLYVANVCRDAVL